MELYAKPLQAKPIGCGDLIEMNWFWFNISLFEDLMFV